MLAVERIPLFLRVEELVSSQEEVAETVKASDRVLALEQRLTNIVVGTGQVVEQQEAR